MTHQSNCPTCSGATCSRCGHALQPANDGLLCWDCVSAALAAALADPTSAYREEANR